MEKKLKKKFRNQAGYNHAEKKLEMFVDEKGNKLASKVQQGQVLPVAEQIKRVLNGNIVETVASGQYYNLDHDSIDWEYFGGLDIVDATKVVQEKRQVLMDEFRIKLQEKQMQRSKELMEKEIEDKKNLPDNKEEKTE